ncbi:MAG TPA: hypothetical protein VME23_02625 [Terracidiphilus sp.]|nr:hypothetical protein [Terracidiphilus sp.]
MKHIPLPNKGCFKASYPATEWREATCTTAPPYPYPTARGLNPETVGDGYDFVAEAVPSTSYLSSAYGNFANSSNVTSVSDSGGQSAFALQLDANAFITSACDGAAVPSECRGWQQFIFSDTGLIFMQYWLFNYGTACPGGWNSYTPPGGGTNDCWKNSSGMSTPTFTAAEVANLEVTGEAENGTDEVIFYSSDPNESGYAVGEDSVLGLEDGWNEAEFNVVGDCCLTEAVFNSGATLIPEVIMDNGTSNAPQCTIGGSGTTGETNSLSLVPASSPVCCPIGESVQFMESSASGVSATCGAGGLEAEGNFTATPYSIDGSKVIITHPIIENEIRTEYSATLEDSTSGATIYYQLFDNCGNSLGGPTGVSSGTTIEYLNIEIDGEDCTYGISGKIYATASGDLQSFRNTIVF